VFTYNVGDVCGCNYSI